MTYNTVAELRNALKDVGKHNKRVKTFAGDFALGEIRTVFERVRSVWGERRGAWMAIDFEGWEREHEIITEFGWSLIRWEPEESGVAEVKEGEKPDTVALKEVREQGHWTVKEYAAYRNGVFVKDNRDVCFWVDLRLFLFLLSFLHRTTISEKQRSCPRPCSRNALVN